MLLDADCVFFLLNADSVFSKKLNADFILYPAVTGELTSACPSLL
jgi:hypothetical protein